jgi:arginase
MNTLISLIGAPTDIGAGSRGASMGPEALRVAHMAAVLQQQGLDVLDRGNLTGPNNPWLPPVDGYRHLAEVTAWNQAVHDAVYAELQGGRLPILLGGDHCLGIGSISAVARHCAHGGQETARAVAGCACRLQHQHLDAQRQYPWHASGLPVRPWPPGTGRDGGHVPAISPKWMRQIGIRSVDEGEKRFVHEQDLEVFDMRYIDEMGMRAAMELALALVDANTHLHVSFDVDFLDPDIAPGVGTTVRGAPTTARPSCAWR